MERVLLETITNQMKQVIGKSQQHLPKANHVTLTWPPPTTNNSSFQHRDSNRYSLPGRQQSVWRCFPQPCPGQTSKAQAGPWSVRWVGDWLTVWWSTVFTQASSLSRAECPRHLDTGPHAIQYLHKHNLTKSADDTKLAAEVDMSEGRAVLQTDCTGWTGGLAPTACLMPLQWEHPGTNILEQTPPWMWQSAPITGGFQNMTGC